MYDTNIPTIDKLQLFSTKVGVARWILTETCAALVSVQKEPSGVRDQLVIDMSVETHSEEAVISITYCANGKRVAFLMDMWSEKTLQLFRSAFDCMPVAFFCGSEQLELVEQGQQLVLWEAGMERMIELRRNHAPRPASKYLEAAFTPDLLANYAIHPNQPNRNANGLPGSMSVTVLVDDTHLAGFPRGL